MSEAKELTELIEDAVNKGANTVEQIHREIADLPLTVLERIGLFERTTSDVRRVQDASIGAVYDVIRDVNFLVTKLAGDLLEQRAEGRPASSTAKPSPGAGA
jgi:uncharacterized NAD-dependent epimerase/dehydratase family protein